MSLDQYTANKCVYLAFFGTNTSFLISAVNIIVKCHVAGSINDLLEVILDLIFCP